MEFLIAALRLVPIVVSAGEDIAQFVGWAIKAGESGAGPTDADWAALHAKEGALRAKLA